jgi:hypothetical protein
MPDDDPTSSQAPHRPKPPRSATSGAVRPRSPTNAENGDGRPPTKRARKAINCEPCRNSKLKCDRSVQSLYPSHRFNEPPRLEIVPAPLVFCGVCPSHSRSLQLVRNNIISQAPLLCATKMAEEMKEAMQLPEEMITSRSCIPFLLFFELSAFITLIPTQKLQPRRPCTRDSSFAAFHISPRVVHLSRIPTTPTTTTAE